MKGVVFTEFIEMLEKAHGFAFTNDVIEGADLASEGVYTAVGTYPASEMVSLVQTLSQKTDTEIPALLKTFGRHLFQSFLGYYPQFMENFDNSFDFLHTVDNHIHVEVKKLYPDAELPRFETKNLENGDMEMIYTSERKMADLAEGLLEAAMEHWNETGTIAKSNLNEDGSKVLFTIRRK